MTGYDSKNNRFFIDRSKSSETDFSDKYTVLSFALRILPSKAIALTLVADVSSVEVLFDDGVTAMTNLFFPDKPLSNLRIKAPQTLKIEGWKLIN